MTGNKLNQFLGDGPHAHTKISIAFNGAASYVSASDPSLMSSNPSADSDAAPAQTFGLSQP